jgi:peptidoglycan hydrolase-like protein with peptidoglycan-binding domain
MKKIAMVLLVSALLFPAISLAAISQNLSYGASGSAVTDLQNFLSTRGFYQGPITGSFFALTRKAVITYQSSMGLPATGFVGSLTRADINAALSEVHASSSATTTQTPAILPVQQSSTAAATTLSPATAAQLASLVYLCNYVEAQGSTTAAAIACTSGTLLDGYNSNAIFRSNIDATIQTLKQKQAAQQSQYSNAQAQALQQYANYLNSQQQNNNAQLVQNELQQLQNTLSQNNSLLNQQYWQKVLQQETAQFQTVQTHCGFNAGVWGCNLPGAN